MVGGGGVGGGGGVVGGGVGGFVGARHVGAPDGVDAEVFVEDHEEVVEPALAEPFVPELGEGIGGGGGGGVLGRRGGVSFEGMDMKWRGKGWGRDVGGWFTRG